MLYGNVAAGGTHVARLMVGMVGLEHGIDDRPLTIFTVAYCCSLCSPRASAPTTS
jgi:hypothetical protein